jgi:hypothetical protein
MIRFNVTDHAIQRFQERIASPMTSYQEAQELLDSGMLTATRLKRRSVHGEDLWHIPALKCVAICASDRYGRTERIVRTVITEQMAQVDCEGNVEVLDEVVEMEITDSAERTIRVLEAAKKHRNPEDHLPSEVRHVPLSRKETAANLNRLITIAQADLAKTKEAEKTRRSAMSDLGNVAKAMLRRAICAALLDPSSQAGSRILAAVHTEDRFKGFLEPSFLRQDSAYQEVLAASTAPTAPAPRQDKSVEEIAEAVRARIAVLEAQAKIYEETATSFPPAQVEALCTYRLLLAQLERLARGEDLQADRLR